MRSVVDESDVGITIVEVEITIFVMMSVHQHKGDHGANGLDQHILQRADCFNEYDM